MNLSKLFETQKKLDERIVKEKGLEGHDLTSEKILALRVELGELTNELPEEFKFWSNKKNNYENALAEYVDCLHFILSIGNEENVDVIRLDVYMKYDEGVFFKIRDLYKTIEEYENMQNNRAYSELFSCFLYLGYAIGFTWEQIEQAYFDKNKVNHERQANGY